MTTSQIEITANEAHNPGIDGDHHSATLARGVPGVLHGVRTYVLQTKEGQITETHSISAGLDYPGVGPEHAWLKDSGRAEYVVATDEDALRGFRICTQSEGIIPGWLLSDAKSALPLTYILQRWNPPMLSGPALSLQKLCLSIKMLLLYVLITSMCF